MKLTPEEIEEFETLVLRLRSPLVARPRYELSAAIAIEQLLEERRGFVEEITESEKKRQR